jgi:holo-[acyl-carrier protein] synthase
MILGTGVDIIEIKRVEEVFHTDRRMRRIFTEEEIQSLGGQNPSRLSGYYAAKEALSKALGTGIRGISFKEMEVLKNEAGRPYFNLQPLKEHLIRIFGTDRVKIHLTISHDRARAMAMVIIEEA